MGKIQSFLQEQKDSIKDIYRTYLVTLIVAIIYSVLLVFRVNEGIDDDLMFHIHVIAIIFMAGSFFVETRKMKKPWVWHIIFFVVAILWDIILYSVDEARYDNEIVRWYLSWICVAYVSVLVVLTIYRIIQNSKLDIYQYLPRVLFGLLKIWGLFLALYLAGLLVLMVFDTLITDIDYWEFVENVEILLCSTVYLPMTLHAFVHTEEDNSRFTKGFITFAMFPCVLIAMAIIYLYIIKIIVSWKLPSNEVFNICAQLFAYGVLIWTFVYGFAQKDEMGKPIGILGKISSICRYLYAPFILLEIICICMRIADCGWTESRYFAILFIILQIAYTLWPKDHYEKLMFVVLGMLVTSTVIPGINAPTVGYLSQKHRFETAVEDGDWRQAGGSYDYLINNLYGTVYLKERYTKSEREEFVEMFNMAGEKVNDSVWNNTEDCTYSWEEQEIDIADYQTIRPINFRDYSEGENSYEDISFSLGELHYDHYDLTECIDYYRDSYKVDLASNNEDKEPMKLSLDATHDFLITSVSFRIDPTKKTYERLRLDGYLLTK
ncbi:MAG: hypothetical protein ACI4EK_00225 [Wujia sp.]